MLLAPEERQGSALPRPDLLVAAGKHRDGPVAAPMSRSMQSTSMTWTMGSTRSCSAWGPGDPGMRQGSQVRYHDGPGQVLGSIVVRCAPRNALARSGYGQASSAVRSGRSHRPSRPGTFDMVPRAGDPPFVNGTVARTPAEPVLGGDSRPQTRRGLERIEEVLAAGGEARRRDRARRARHAHRDRGRSGGRVTRLPTRGSRLRGLIPGGAADALPGWPASGSPTVWNRRRVTD